MEPLLSTLGLAGPFDPLLLCEVASAEPLRGILLAKGSVEPLLKAVESDSGFCQTPGDAASPEPLLENMF